MTIPNQQTVKQEQTTVCTSTNVDHQKNEQMISKQNGEIKQHQNQVLKLETPPVEAGDRLPIEKIIGQTETTKAHESPLERY